jgi:hypothetical protein
MKPRNDIHELIKKLQIKASTNLDRKVHRAIAESEPVVPEMSMWRYITKGWVIKLAVAAAVIIAFGAGFVIGQRSESMQPMVYSRDLTDYMPTPTITEAEDGFWQQKALAAMQPRPYSESQFGKTSPLSIYKQYLKEKDYD